VALQAAGDACPQRHVGGPLKRDSCRGKRWHRTRAGCRPLFSAVHGNQLSR
jgi:hypothetical protein